MHNDKVHSDVKIVLRIDMYCPLPKMPNKIKPSILIIGAKNTVNYLDIILLTRYLYVFFTHLLHKDIFTTKNYEPLVV